MLDRFNKLYYQIITEEEQLNQNSNILEISDLETLQKLAESKDYKVRMEVAANPNCSEELLTKLSEDSDWRVLQEVAKNPKTPEDILSKLISDEHIENIQELKLHIAENPNTAKDILIKLVDDDDPKIKELASKTLKEK